MKYAGIGYLQLGIHGHPAPDNNYDLDGEAPDEFLCTGTGVEESFHSCHVTIQYRIENNSNSDVAIVGGPQVCSIVVRVWSMEIFAQSKEDATRRAIREFRLLSCIAGEYLEREVISVSVEWSD